MTQPLHIKNAQIWDDVFSSYSNGAVRHDLYVANERIANRPAAGALTVDLEGYTIFPGLVNAHDHLELNHFPRSKFRDVYDNAHQWGEDMNGRLETEPYKSLRAYALDDRLFIGGLKNLLCGVTTVAHHNPPHRALFRKDFPVRVLQKYGWSHSLHFNTTAEIVESYRKTPKDWPWFIHLAEGRDEIAAKEYQRLKVLGCVGKNTVMVHGVGISPNENTSGRGLVICPSTNQYLLDKVTYQTDSSFYDWSWKYGGIALGSDSRLTADGDLLDEMRFALHNIMDQNVIVAVGMFQDAAHQILAMVMSSAAKLLNCEDMGELRNDFSADFIAIRSTEDDATALCNARRAELALVVRDGIPRIGDPDMMAKFPHIQTTPATLDGVPKAIHIDIARRIHQCRLKERGLELDEIPEKRFFLF